MVRHTIPIFCSPAPALNTPGFFSKTPASQIVDGDDFNIAILSALFLSLKREAVGEGEFDGSDCSLSFRFLPEMVDESMAGVACQPPLVFASDPVDDLLFPPLFLLTDATA